MPPSTETRTFRDAGIDVPSGASGEVRAICPNCAHTRKPGHQRERDLAVNVSAGTWHCHHCSWSGGLGAGDDWRARTAPAKRYDRPRPIQPAGGSLHERMIDWFASRGIGQEIVDRNRITTTDRYCGPCGKVVPVIAFPYYRDGEHINTTYRCYEKHFSQEKNAERILYGLDELTPADHVIICEGQLDKLAFEQAGLTNVLSVPDGAPNAGSANYASKFTYLESAGDLFPRFQRVILAADNDPNGRALNDELGRRIGRERCRVVQWPDTCKDANDVLLLIGEPMIQEAVERARPYPVEGIVYSDDLWDAVLDLYERGYDPGLRLGLGKLDDHYRPRAGLLSIVTGHSSHGKSLWLDHVIVKLATRHDWRIGVFSPENQPLERHWANLVEIHLGRPFDRGRTERISRDELYAAKGWMAEHFAFVLPEQPSVEGILDRASVLRLQWGLRGLVIDPWNEIEHACPPGRSMTDYISEVLGKIRRFARNSDIHVWLMAHPTKYPSTTERDAPPTLNDISGSVNFRNKADYGVTIWRNPMDEKIGSQCHIQKIRFAETGKPGKVEFRYDFTTRQMQVEG